MHPWHLYSVSIVSIVALPLIMIDISQMLCFLRDTFLHNPTPALHMPRISHWPYKRHFGPLTMHCEFPPERALDPPILTQHKVFSRAVDLIPPTMPGLPAPLTSSAPPKILKPRGEVSRLNRGGYNLQEKLGWSLSEYEDIRVGVLC